MTEPEREWIYAVDGERRGPASATEIAALISGDRLPAGTLVWKPGMATWLPAGDVPEIARYCAPPAPLPPTISRVRQDVAVVKSELGVRPGLAPPTPRPQRADISPTSNNGSPSVAAGHHPWRRYFARLLDTCMVWLPACALLAVGVGAVLPEVVVVVSAVLREVKLKLAATSHGLFDQLMGLLLVFASGIPLETLMLSTIGTTPGKWLFGISVRRADGGTLTFGQSAARAFGVSVQGMGFGVPIISLFTLVSAYQRLQKTGSTLWDAATDSVVSHVAWGPWRWVFAVLAVLASITVLFLLSILEKAFSRA